jgi:hypothetical protein
MPMRRVDWRVFVLVLTLAALWWFITLARGCQGNRPRPAELIPSEKQDGQK